MRLVYSRSTGHCVSTFVSKALRYKILKKKYSAPWFEIFTEWPNHSFFNCAIFIKKKLVNFLLEVKVCFCLDIMAIIASSIMPIPMSICTTNDPGVVGMPISFLTGRLKKKKKPRTFRKQGEKLVQTSNLVSWEKNSKIITRSGTNEPDLLLYSNWKSTGPPNLLITKLAEPSGNSLTGTDGTVGKPILELEVDGLLQHSAHQNKNKGLTQGSYLLQLSCLLMSCYFHAQSWSEWHQISTSITLSFSFVQILLWYLYNHVSVGTWLILCQNSGIPRIRFDLRQCDLVTIALQNC